MQVGGKLPVRDRHCIMCIIFFFFFFRNNDVLPRCRKMLYDFFWRVKKSKYERSKSHWLADFATTILFSILVVLDQVFSRSMRPKATPNCLPQE